MSDQHVAGGLSVLFGELRGQGRVTPIDGLGDRVMLVQIPSLPALRCKTAPINKRKCTQCKNAFSATSGLPDAS